MKLIADCIDYIEENLNDDRLSVESVARASGYSRHYFQRLFTRSLGLTLGTYIHGRRMTRAAAELSATDRRIIEIAQDAGFESQEAFSRAFKDYFGKPPARYRADKDIPVLKSFPAFDRDLTNHLARHPELASPRLIDHPGFSLAALSGTFRRGAASAIESELWPTFMRRRHELQAATSDINYGVLKLGGESDGADYETFVYGVATEIPHKAPLPHGFEKIDVAAQRYAVFEHKGGMSALPLTNKYIWGVWAAQSGETIAASPDLEVYPASFAPGADETMEVWIPIVRQ